MKLLKATKIKDWDAFTIIHEPVSSIDLMERAATLCAHKIVLLLLQKPSLQSIVIFCGAGNNGGDGLALARLLSEKGKQVQVYLIIDGHKTTADFEVNLKRLPPAIAVQKVTALEQMRAIAKNVLVVDAIFGYRLNRAPENIAAAVIDYINESEAYIVAIDIPSGLPTEILAIEEITGRSITEADITYTFQLPKQSFLHEECFKYTGNFEVIDFGLHPAFLEQIVTHHFYVTNDLVQSYFKPRLKFSHKGTFGHALMVVGSYGKLGAAILSSKAALRTGCGLLTSFIPKVGYTVLQTALPEAMILTDDEVFEIRNFPVTINYAAIGVGPGLGTNAFTEKGFANWLKNIHQPIVIDADGLNLCASILSKDSNFSFPPNSILTPHPKEFDRLAGHSNNSFERLQKQIMFTQKHNVVVVLKGAFTSIALPNGNVYFNSSGNPVLATAGSGDVLTGIITSLLAQQYSTSEAAIMGVYLHGVCADIWKENGNQTMIAGDIIEMIPKVLQRIFN